MMPAIAALDKVAVPPSLIAQWSGEEVGEGAERVWGRSGEISGAEASG